MGRSRQTCTTTKKDDKATKSTESDRASKATKSDEVFESEVAHEATKKSKQAEAEHKENIGPKTDNSKQTPKKNTPFKSADSFDSPGMKRPSTSSGETPTKLFRPKKSLPASDTISDTKDVVGYVGCVTQIKVNQSNTRQYFTVHIKTSKVDFCRVMVSNHRQLRRVRQDFVNRFHNHEAVTLKKLKPGADILFFNNYSEVLVYDEVMSFQLNDADRVPVADIDDQGLVLSMVGKFKFCGEVKNKPYNKADGRQRVDRLLNAFFSDGVATIKCTIWGDLIDIVKENMYMQIACTTSKVEVDGEISLYTTPSTKICYLAEDKAIDFPEETAVESPISNKDVHSCNQVAAIHLESFFPCRKCKRKLAIDPQSGMCSCSNCKREVSLQFMRDTSKETHVATVDVLLVNGEEITVTIFEEVMVTLFEELPGELDIKKKILSMKNFKIEVNNKMVAKAIYTEA